MKLLDVPLALALACFAVVAACDDPIARGWLVDRTRVLGARVEATAEPTRASLRSGEEAKVTWLIASPSAPPPIGLTFAVCAPPEGNFAAPHCDSPVLAFGSRSPMFGALETTFVVPPAAGDQLLVLAAFCAEGMPALDATKFSGACPRGEPLLASLVLTLGGANVSPSIADDAIVLDDLVLPPTTAGAPGTACAPSPDAPLLPADGRTHKLAFRFSDAQRETFAGGREALLLTHVVTAGELERQYSAFDPDEAPKIATVEWKPPSPAEVEGGRLVEITFVLRDGRGGSSFARRAVCARKP